MATLHFFGTIFVGIFAVQDWKISTFGWFFGLFNVIPVVIEVRRPRRASPPARGIGTVRGDRANAFRSERDDRH